MKIFDSNGLPRDVEPIPGKTGFYLVFKQPEAPEGKKLVHVYLPSDVTTEGVGEVNATIAAEIEACGPITHFHIEHVTAIFPANA